MEKKLKSWQGWLLFGGSMVVVFVLGLCVSALMERRAEVASIFNNRKTVIKGIEARNELFKDDFPREYQTWTETAKTDFESEFNGNVAVDALGKTSGNGYSVGRICILQKTIPLRADTCMPSRILRQPCVPVRLPLMQMVRNRPLAGLARVPMSPV